MSDFNFMTQEQIGEEIGLNVVTISVYLSELGIEPDGKVGRSYIYEVKESDLLKTLKKEKAKRAKNKKEAYKRRLEREQEQLEADEEREQSEMPVLDRTKLGENVAGDSDCKHVFVPFTSTIVELAGTKEFTGKVVQRVRLKELVCTKCFRVFDVEIQKQIERAKRNN